MPIYEYSCTACGRTFEKIQKVGSRTLRKCEECGGKLEKLVSRSAFHLKGGGWFDSGYNSTTTGGKTAVATSGATPSEPSSSAGKPTADGIKSDSGSKKSTTGKSKSD